MANGPYDREDRDPRSARGWDDDRRPRGMSDRDDRGFFERARDQISSWYGDDEPGRDPRDRDERGFFEQSRERRPSSPSDDHARAPRQRDEGQRRPYTGRSPARPPEGRDDDGYRPMTGDYSRFQSGQRERAERPSQQQRDRGGTAPTSGPAHDRHYNEWRQRQIDELDRDYDDYRRENQSKFDSDFSGWRSTRQSKRQMLGSIREHMQVVGADDQPVGTVDKVRGDRIVLTKDDSPDDKHHSIGCATIDRVEGDRVILDKKADEAKASWGDEDRDRALFERDGDREPGAHILDRSFSGTY